tara:strand:+ start:481 stop:708 length:228 start_codon:yes stop_codon:yes gene_type:complete
MKNSKLWKYLKMKIYTLEDTGEKYYRVNVNNYGHLDPLFKSHEEADAAGKEFGYKFFINPYTSGYRFKIEEGEYE